jgi:hypothetical protein
MKDLSSAISSNDSESFIDVLKTACLNEIDDVAALEKIKLLLNDSLKVLNSRINDAKNKAFLKLNSSDISNRIVVHKINDASFLEPRGKVNAIIYNNGISIEGKQSTTFMSWSNISHIVRVPSHSSVKKEGEEILIIRMVNPIPFNNKDTKHFLWNLSNSVSKTDGTIESDTVIFNISQYYNKKIININKSIFQTVIHQKSFLRCYKGTQEGVLYPLKCGLIFIKPLVFIPNEEIASVSAGRGGGSGNTKYVDFHVTTTSDKSFEFTNIERDELPSLQVRV